MDENYSGVHGESRRDDEMDTGTGFLLSVSVLGCDSLKGPKGDNSTADVYVVVECLGSKRKTKVKHKTKSPIFGEIFDFEADSHEEMTLSVSVMHKNMISSDVLLGRCTVNPKKFVLGREVVETAGLGEGAGSIDLKLELKNK
mmetsp:Transcript_17538/g.42815  ORF Transcript_17538/g.42815 Transcript_17538/m.42815 type:complete len:143 (-) Transcript_17538:89-517(-)